MKRLIILLFLFVNISLFSADFWEKLNFPFEKDTIQSIKIDKYDFIYIGTRNNGIVRSTDSGNTWEKKNNGLDTIRIWNIAIDSLNNLYASAFPLGIYKSTDQGNNWLKINNGIVGDNGFIRADCIEVNKYNTIFAWIRNDNIYKSSDLGENWLEVTSKSDLTKKMMGGSYSLLINSQNYIFATPYFEGLYRSIDLGNSWHQILDSSNVYVLELKLNSLDHIYINIYQLGFYISYQNGYDFKKINTIPFPDYFIQLLINKYNHIYLFDKYLYRSIDNCDNWVLLDTAKINTSLFFYCFDSKGYIYAGTWGQGLYRSKNPMEIFTLKTNISPYVKQLDILQDSIEYSISVTDKKYYNALKNCKIVLIDSLNNKSDSLQTDTLGKAKYICHVPNDIKNGNYHIKFIISEFGYANIDTVDCKIIINLTDVKDNHSSIYFASSPNPFSESTTIKYSIPFPSHVKLSIYDIFGREVAILVDGWQEAGENIYHLPFNIYPFGSGIYFCWLQAGGESKVIKVVKIE